jgi:SAM-dependent methyltransferase
MAIAVSEEGRPSMDAMIAELAEVAAGCPVTGHSGKMLLKYYRFIGEAGDDLWPNYEGKRMLDICAGLSDLTAKLLSLGADAYALDYGYDNDGSQQLLRRVSRGRIFRETIPNFLSSVRDNPQRYVKGSAIKLPFEDNSFDGITSHYGIFGVMDYDLDSLRASVDEAIRVLKPEVGILEFGPYRDGRVMPQQRLYQVRFVRELGEREDILLSIRHPSYFSFDPFNHVTPKSPPEDRGLITIRKLARAA